MTSLAMYKEVLSRDWLYRWLAIVATAVIAAIGFFVIRMSIDDHLLHQVLGVLFIPFAVGLIFAALASRIRSLTFVLSACADFFCSVAQWWAFAAIGLVLTYVAASANLPLMDDVFARLDATMGFHWADTYAWVERHPVFQTALRTAYSSGGVQLLGLFLIHCMRAPGIGSGELMWNFMVSLLITIAISVILPAAAMPGTIGQHHIDVFLAVRNGGITVLDAPTIAGLVTFPSWHAAMGVIFIYSARSMKWLLAVLAPLNVLLIAATPPCGGHYLVDTIAGLAVAAISILVVRKIRRSIVGQEAGNAAARRADGWGQA
jgi:membrane-associated phospholipid phosphatase